MTLDETVTRMLRARIPPSGAMSDAQLSDVLRLLGKWRSQKIAATLVARDGPVVRSGPFAGLVLGTTGTEGGHAPRLLGCYEQELHAHLERLIAQGFPRVANIGCADGYYAVGLARRMPGAMVHAHDSSADARRACAATAEANDVAARVTIGGEVGHAELDALAGAGSWLVVDIEGAEDALLDPAAAPALAAATILVECHEGPCPGVTARLEQRFAPTHAVTRIDVRIMGVELPSWMQRMSHIDQLLAVWEWRHQPTPWLVLEPR